MKELKRELPPGVQDVMFFPAPQVNSNAAEQFIWTHLYDPHFTVVPSFVKTFDRLDNEGIRAVVKYAIARGDFCKLVKFCIDSEVASVPDVTVVARESSLYTVVLTEIIRAVASSWIDSIRYSYKEFLQVNDPVSRLELARAITSKIAMATNKHLSYIWHYSIKAYTNAWGKEHAKTAIISTVFLRFVCIALVTPLEYGLVEKPQMLDAMARVNEFSSIIQAFASGKEFTEYAGQYKTAQAMGEERKLVAEFVENLCAIKKPKNLKDSDNEFDSLAVAPLLKWWSKIKPDKNFLQRWGRKMRRITDWRDSHNWWKLGSDQQAWMNWSSFRGMITPELLGGLQKRFSKSSSKSALRRGLSGKLKRGAPVQPSVTQPVNVAEEVNTLQDSHEFVVLVFYRGFWCFFCEKWMKKWAKQLENVQRFGGCIVGITSQDQTTAETTRQQWGIPFPLYGDPENVMAKSVFNDIETKRSNETAVYPRGMGQPSVFAYTKTGVLLHSWSQRAHPRNNEGASDREEPSMSAKIACTVFARTRNLIPRNESLDSSDWSALQDSSSEYSESDTMTDFESTLAECEDEEACRVLAEKLRQEPEFAKMLYNMTGRKVMQDIRRESRGKKNRKQ